MGEDNKLHNRELHISGLFIEQKQDVQSQKQDIDYKKQDIEDKLKEMLLSSNVTAHTTENILKLFDRFKSETIFGRTEVMTTIGISASPASELTKKCWN